MTVFSASKSICAAALLIASSAVGAVAASERLPKTFHGSWTSDLANCGETGESTPTRIDGRFILEYETGWTIKTWSRRGDVWVGRGSQGDDQGRMPATVRLRLRADGSLDFSSVGKGPFGEEPGLIRCPASSDARR